MIRSLFLAGSGKWGCTGSRDVVGHSIAIRKEVQKYFQRGRHQDELAQKRRLSLRQSRSLRQSQKRKGGQQVQVSN